MKDELTTKDFDLEPPDSLRDFIEDQMRDSLDDDLKRGKEVKPITDEVIDELMPRVFQWIEKQALAVYKSNEPWALKAWAYSNILKEAVMEEGNQLLRQRIIRQADQPRVEELISPIVDWQKEQPIDPIAYYKRRLTYTLRLKPATVRVYLVTAARFVGRIGRKNHYSDEDVMEYLDWIGERLKESSYIAECWRLQQFLRNLPGANRKYKLPIPIKPLDEVENFNQPMFSNEEVEKICWACVLDKIRPDMVLRIVIASIYGGRKGELGLLSNGDIELDGDKSSLFIRTEKKGTRKKQPIPQTLVPLFSATIYPITHPTLHNRLKRIVTRAEIPWQYGMGFHSFRRNVVTLIDQIAQSDLDKSKFMRWSKSRQLGMLDRYRQKPSEVSDMAILSQHPRVAMWEEIIPYLFKYNDYYTSDTYVKICIKSNALKPISKVFKGRPHLTKLLNRKRPLVSV